MTRTTDKYINLFTDQESLKDYWDLKSSMDTYYKEGFEQGEKNKAIEIAKKAIKEGFDVEIVSKLTRLTIEEIEALSELNNKK